MLAAALLDADNVLNVIQVVLRFYEGIQHIHEDRALLLSRARASLPVLWVMNAKSVLERWIDMILEDARQIDGVFLQVIKRPDHIEKGAVIHLSAQFDSISIGVDVALPDVLEYVVWLDRIT